MSYMGDPEFTIEPFGAEHWVSRQRILAAMMAIQILLAVPAYLEAF